MPPSSCESTFAPKVELSTRLTDVRSATDVFGLGLGNPQIISDQLADQTGITAWVRALSYCALILRSTIKSSRSRICSTVIGRTSVSLPRHALPD